MDSLHDLVVETIDGEDKRLGDYAGNALLIVNVASKCGLTPQYTDLQALHERYKDRGFSVLGFPCNQFGAQEPGSHEEIKEFCSTRYDVDFPLFAKIEVNGPGRAPLYERLTSQKTEPDGPGDIKWNFAKFLVDKEGKIVARFPPTTEPLSEDITGRVEKLLG